MILYQDCLRLIIEELHEDKNSLFSCLLVNRFLCKIVVPILWKDPWLLLSMTNNINFPKRTKSFFNILLLHLSEESKKYLESQGIDINSRLSYKQNPLFEYVKFCKYVKHRHVTSGRSIYDDIFRTYDDHQRNILVREIYKLFMSKCPTIKFLDVTGILQPFYKYPGAKISLSELYELHCKSDDNSLIFYELAKICRLIEKFFILYNNINGGLAKLIETQKKVKYVKMIYINDDVNDQLIDQAIMKHGNNLIYLDLSIKNNFNFLNNLFPKLINLQQLILHGDLSYRFCLYKQSLLFPHSKLQIVQLCSITFQTIISIIENTEGNLQVIWIDSAKYDTVDQAGQLVRTISRHCPNLKYLKIFLKDRHLEDFKQLLVNCRLLEGIIIYTDNVCLNYYGNELLDILIQFASINLHKFELRYCKFKLESLNLFFNNWRNRKALWLYSINIFDYFGPNIEKFENMIESYKKHGIIQKFEHFKSYNFINDYKEIKLI